MPVNPFDSQMLLVTGKGGVGRSTATAALGLAAARGGRRVACIEVNGLGSVAAAFGLPDRSFEPQPAAPGVDAISLSPYESLNDFGRRKLRVGGFLTVVLGNRIVHAMIDGIPGMHDLLQIGKLRNMLAEPTARDAHYDIAILDAPATGHGLTLLDTGHSMAELTRVGPFYEEARQIDEWFGNRASTGIVVVTLPERLPVQEALELVDGLEDHRDQLVAVVMNQTSPLSSAEDGVDEAALASAMDAAGRPDLSALLREERARQQRERVAGQLLREGLAARGLSEVPILRLPRVTQPITRERVELLANAVLEGLPHA